MTRKKQEHDFSIVAFRVVQEATEQTEPEQPRKIDYAAIGHKGGLKGGKARAEKLTPEQRSKIARKAAQKRWSKKSSI